MTPLERAARAATDDLAKRYQDERDAAYIADRDDLRSVVIDGRVDMVALMRTVLQAIRDPSAAMISAAMAIDPIAQFDVSPDESWQAMIDAALEEG